MKRRNRDITIFGMSALDLFASAMGAFILLAIVIFPYFPNSGSADQRDLDAALERLRQEEDDNTAMQAVLRQIREDLEQRLRRVREEAERRVAAAERAAEDAQRDAAESRRAAEESRRAAEEAQRDAADAQRDAEESRRAAADAQRDAEESRRAAADAQRDAEESRRAAADAQRELEDLTFPHLDLVIALDVTNSMEGEIRGLRTELNDLIDVLTSLAPSVAMGIVTFTDDCAGPPLSVLELTDVSGSATRLSNFVQTLRPIRQGCNYDNPEAFLAALRAATGANWRPRSEERRVVMITDNPAYPDETEAAVAAARSFAATGGGRSVSTVHVRTPDAEPSTGAFLERVADAGGGEAVAAGGSMTANLLRSML